MKLSAKQAEVVRRMRDGWKLLSMEGLTWLQRGRSEGNITVSSSTRVALLRRGVIIEVAREYPVVRYKLVEG